MNKVRDIKKLISIITQELKKNKRTIQIASKKVYKQLLICLWKEGYIYGYHKTAKSYLVYLKYTKFKNTSIKKIGVNTKNSNYSDLKQKLCMELVNTIVLLSTDVGVISSKVCIKKGIGGWLTLRI